jgi:uncharacterized membrane protein
VSFEPSSRLEILVVRVLRTGAIASAAFLASGLLLQSAAPTLGVGALLIQAGLIILMATPVARVVTSVIQYTVQRDWVFAGLTLTVLVVLLGSLLFGIKG